MHAPDQKGCSFPCGPAVNTDEHIARLLSVVVCLGHCSYFVLFGRPDITYTIALGNRFFRGELQ